MAEAELSGGAHISALPDAGSLGIRIAELPELPIERLQAAWTDAWGTPPSKAARRRFLMLGIAWRWQARIHGGPSRQLEARLAVLMAAQRDGGKTDLDALSRGQRLMPGTRLVRDWRGTRHEVHVLEDGFLWQGRRHGSLSAIASAISGARRNGPAFFGLRSGGGGR